MEANVIREARIRVTVTREAGKQDTMPNMVVSAVPAPSWPPVEAVVCVPWTRNENGAIAGIKSLSYGENALAMMHAREHGAGEAIFANTRGNLCEGSASNVFLVLNERLLTPSLTSGCLPGVTRGLVLDLCRQAGINAFEEDVPLAALAEASEAFLTSSTREVHPISRVDARCHAPVPGPLTRRLVELFDELKMTCKDP